MEESILNSVKKMLGILPEQTAFDSDLIIHINSALSTLFQIGVGETPFRIEGDSESWSDLLGDVEDIESVKTYIYMKVRMYFDTPSGSVENAFKEMISELEWRIEFANTLRKEAENV